MMQRTGLGFGILMLGAMALSCAGKVDPSSSSNGGDTMSAANGRVGELGLRLVPVSGITLNQVHFIVTRGSPELTPAPAIVSEGNLPTAGTADTFTFGIPLPVGGNYYISLSAASAETGDDITCSGSYGPFVVDPNATTSIDFTLTCYDNSNGQVLTTVDVDTDACPRLVVDSVTAEPKLVDVGREAGLHASAHDLDDPTQTLRYAWAIVDEAQASVGVFTPALGRDVSFRCNNAGEVKLRVTVSNEQCDKSLETVVGCGFFDRCGNGVLDAGESCDRALDPSCPADCTRVCGDGIAESGEECDGVGTTRTCTLDCRSWSTDACVECEQAGDCFAASDNCLGPAGSFTPAQQKACTDVALCIRQSGCLNGPTGSITKCYCGTLSAQVCSTAPFDLSQPGAPNGPCAAIMQNGMTGVTTNTAMLGGFLSLSRPTGQADQRLQCDKVSGCATACGLD